MQWGVIYPPLCAFGGHCALRVTPWWSWWSWWSWQLRSQKQSKLPEPPPPHVTRYTLQQVDGIINTTTPTDIVFEVVSGPGRVLGVGSGDPAAHYKQQGRVVGTFAGTAKVLVQVTVDCVSPGQFLQKPPLPPPTHTRLNEY